MCHVCNEFTIKLPTVNCDSDTYLLEVNDTSPIGHRRVVEQIARYFQKEMKYDFVQYAASRPSGGDYEPYLPAVAFLFMDTDLLHYTKSGKSTLKAAGACCFRKRQREAGKDWELDWVWIHPFMRRQGVLSFHWDLLKIRLGEFTLCPPLSSGMEAFLSKNA